MDSLLNLFERHLIKKLGKSQSAADEYVLAARQYVKYVKGRQDYRRRPKYLRDRDIATEFIDEKYSSVKPETKRSKNEALEAFQYYLDKEGFFARAITGAKYYFNENPGGILLAFLLPSIIAVVGLFGIPYLKEFYLSYCHTENKSLTQFLCKDQDQIPASATPHPSSTIEITVIEVTPTPQIAIYVEVDIKDDAELRIANTHHNENENEKYTDYFPGGYAIIPAKVILQNQSGMDISIKDIKFIPKSTAGERFGSDYGVDLESRVGEDYFLWQYSPIEISDKAIISGHTLEIPTNIAWPISKDAYALLKEAEDEITQETPLTYWDTYFELGHIDTALDGSKVSAVSDVSSGRYGMGGLYYQVLTPPTIYLSIEVATQRNTIHPFVIFLRNPLSYEINGESDSRFSGTKKAIPEGIVELVNKLQDFIEQGKLEPAYIYFHTPRFQKNYAEAAYMSVWETYCLDPNIYIGDELETQPYFWEVWVEMQDCRPGNEQEDVENWRFCMVFLDNEWKIDDYVKSTGYKCNVPYYKSDETN